MSDFWKIYLPQAAESAGQYQFRFSQHIQQLNISTSLMLTRSLHNPEFLKYINSRHSSL